MKPFYVELLRDENGNEIPALENGERPVGIAISEHLIPVVSLGEDGNPKTTILSRIGVLWLDVGMRSQASPAYHLPEQLRWLELLDESEGEFDGDEGDEEEDDNEGENAENANEVPESSPQIP